MHAPIFISSLKTPNPAAIKFSVENVMLTELAWNFSSPEQAKQSALAEKLFAFDFVSQVFISQDFITVNKKPSTPDWDELQAEVKAVLQTHLSLREPLTPDDPIIPSEEQEDEKIIAIRKLFEERVRPATRQDGGDMTFKSLEDGVLKLSLAGACVQCPYAPRTIKAGVEVLLKQSFPEIREVTCDEVDWSQPEI